MERCILPPAGWFCTREGGHEGPCAARASATYSTGWASPTLGRIYGDVERLEAALAQPHESGIGEALRRLLKVIEETDCELGAIT